MIRKETEKRILQEICTNKILPEIEDLGFKYLKSKSRFLKKGKDVDISIQIYNQSQPFELNSNEELQFKFVIRSSIQLTKFNKWHKKEFKKESVGLSNKLSASYTFICPISFDSFSSKDFYEPSKAKMFKLKMLESFKNLRGDVIYHLIENLRKIVSEEIIPPIEKVDNLDEIISMENIPKILKIDVLYFKGDKEKAKKEYLDFHSTIKKQILKEDKTHILSHYSRTLKDLSDKFEKLFNEEIDDKDNLTSVKISKENTKKIIIGESQYQMIASLSNIFPPINLNSGLANNSNRGLRVHDEGFTIFHRENLSSMWDLEINKSDEKEYQFNGLDIPSQISELIPAHAYDSATPQTKDGRFFFVGGYNTKSFLINVEKQTKQVLWAHEAFKKGYKDYYNVSHNFGVNQASFIQNDKYIIACACHAKNAIWELSSLKRIELELPFKYTFEGAPPSTEFANDVKQIEVFNRTNHIALVIRKNALILDSEFKMIGEIENVQLIKVSENEEVVGIITNDNKIEIYKKNTIGNKA